MYWLAPVFLDEYLFTEVVQDYIVPSFSLQGKEGLASFTNLYYKHL
jgi:hypothetical protein